MDLGEIQLRLTIIMMTVFCWLQAGSARDPPDKSDLPHKFQ